jgi:hypothetical protein
LKESLKQVIKMSSNLNAALDHVQQAIGYLSGELVGLVHATGFDAVPTVAVSQLVNALQEAVVKLGEIQIIP